mgnify:CR=1 FL=1
MEYDQQDKLIEARVELKEKMEALMVQEKLLEERMGQLLNDDIILESQ